MTTSHTYHPRIWYSVVYENERYTYSDAVTLDWQDVIGIDQLATVGIDPGSDLAIKCKIAEKINRCKAKLRGVWTVFSFKPVKFEYFPIFWDADGTQRTED